MTLTELLALAERLRWDWRDTTQEAAYFLIADLLALVATRTGQPPEAYEQRVLEFARGWLR